MAITVEAFTGSATIGTTEWSLVTNTAGPDASTTVGTFQAFIDLSAIVAVADLFVLSIYEKVRTGDTQQKITDAYFALNSLATPIWVTDPLILGIGWDITIKKSAGTDRLIKWRISQVA